jgi:hypothetical protein
VKVPFDIGTLFFVKAPGYHSNADILTFRDGDFVWNFVLNIFVGIFENIWGIITGIYDLILFVTRDVWVIIGQVADWLEKVGPEVADALEAQGLDLKTTMEEFRKEGPEKQESLLSSKNINQLLRVKIATIY